MLRRYKTLLLAGVSAISKTDAEIIVQFTKDGGTVVADLNPGIFNEHLGPHATNPLAELFGDLKPAAITTGNPYEGVNVNGAAGIAPMTERQVGKGRAILMNFTLAGMASALSTPGKFDAFMDRLADKLKLRPQLKFSGLPGGSIIRLSHGDGFNMVAFANNAMSEAGKGEGEVTVTFPKSGHIYEVAKGFVKQGDTVTHRVRPAVQVFHLLRAGAGRPGDQAFKRHTATPGVPLQLDLFPFAKGRVLNLQLLDAKGGNPRPRNEISVHERIMVDGEREFSPIHFAYTDPKGEYTLRLMDVATGLVSTRKITLK